MPKYVEKHFSNRNNSNVLRKILSDSPMVGVMIAIRRSVQYLQHMKKNCNNVLEKKLLPSTEGYYFNQINYIKKHFSNSTPIIYKRLLRLIGKIIKRLQFYISPSSKI